MKLKNIHIFLFLFLLVILISTDMFSQKPSEIFPQNHLDLKKPIDYEKMEKVLKEFDRENFITVTPEGKTVQGHSLYLAHLYRGHGKSQWRVFFFAQQHGDEPAGKDALLYLIRYIATQPDWLPEDVELWIMPMVNPDGAEANKRRNANNVDLNRDHQLLSQPETQTLHRIFRRIMPHVAVDCHEFNRTSSDYLKKGWIEWPLIMMDCANNPLFDQRLYAVGVSVWSP